MAPTRIRAIKRQVWNKGLVIGKRDGLTPAQVKRIRRLLDDRGAAGIRDLALFSMAIDTMLHGHNLVRLAVGDVQSRNGSVRSVIKAEQTRGAPPVWCALSRVAEGTRKMDRSIRQEAHRLPVLWHRPMSTRQLSHLVEHWITEAGLDPKRYTIESLRRTKALHILRGTGDLQTVRALLGHVKIESTARYLGLKTKADPIEVSRAFDI
jgi:site-specific recombinase XerD